MSNEKTKQAKSEKGITLVALIITVVVMLILAGVAIAAVIDGDGLFSKTRQATETYKNSVKTEEDKIQELKNEIDMHLPIQSTKLDEKINGSYDENKTIHVPKLIEGMTAIYWDNGVEKELTESSTELEWNNWYDYKEQTGSTATEGSGTSRWANAVTKDSSGNITGYYVWIPRYEYKITYNDISDYSKGGIIDVNFIEIGKEATEGYIIHPAFQNNPKQGGWDSELPGFWVAKYPAGFQANTVNNNGVIINSDEEVQYSDLYYTTPNIEYINALGQEITNENCNNVKISYPVFKPLTYAYNCINLDSSYRISQEIKNASDFYGLNNVDTHLMKNSEWGAVAYLAYSQYGRNGIEPNKNNIYLRLATNNMYYITGMYSNTTNADNTNGEFIGNTYDTILGQLGSSTGNITGVYDLNGCVWEFVASYVNSKEVEENDYIPAMSLVGAEDKYKMVYNSATEDSSENNYLENNFKGDAIRETSSKGSGINSWNESKADFPYDDNNAGFFLRSCGINSNSGIFAFDHASGSSHFPRGFRIVLLSTI